VPPMALKFEPRCASLLKAVLFYVISIIFLQYLYVSPEICTPHKNNNKQTTPIIVLFAVDVTGHFVMVPLNLTYLHCLQHSLSSIYIVLVMSSVS